MIPLRRVILIRTFKLSDICIVWLSAYLSILADSSQVGSVAHTALFTTAMTLPNMIFIIAVAAVWHITFSVCGLYRSRRFSTQAGEVADIVKATTVGTLLLLALVTLWGYLIAMPTVLAVFWSTSTCITVMSRVIMRLTLKYFRRRGRNLRHVLIVGTNRRAMRFAEKVKTTPELGYHVIGFMDSKWEGFSSRPEAYRENVWDLSLFTSFIRQHAVDEVIICLPIKSFYDRFYELITLCENQGIMVRFLSDIFDLKRAKIRVEQFEDFSVLTVSDDFKEGWQILLKRCIDVSLSLLIILVLFPLFLLVALLIKITSPGPVFYVQERVGYHKRNFHLYKFRTMVNDAEKKQAELEGLNEVDGPVFKIWNDPRITPFGRLLRRTSIDELPQLFNVVKGDMSLVGPRPLPLRDYNGFDQDWHRRRFSVRPGITCLWQIAGRSTLSFEKWMDLDMQYIDQWSLWLDVKILLMTIPAVVRGAGAA